MDSDDYYHALEELEQIEKALEKNLDKAVSLLIRVRPFIRTYGNVALAGLLAEIDKFLEANE